MNRKALCAGSGESVGGSNKVCPNCGRKMKQQFIGLRHCKCGTSWGKGTGFFERSGDMVFSLQRRVVKKGKSGIKTKQIPVIRYKTVAPPGEGAEREEKKEV